MVKSVFKDVESPLKFLTSDGIPNAFFKNGKIVADGSKFDGLPANEKNINEMLDDTDYGVQAGPTEGDTGVIYQGRKMGTYSLSPFIAP